MQKKMLSLPILLLLTISLLSALSLNTIGVSAGEYPSIYIHPPSIIDSDLTPGKNFTVSIKTDYTGSNIIGYQFTLSFNPTVIHGVKVTNGDLIVDGPPAVFMPGTFDNTNGKLSLTGAFFFFITPPPPTATGPGTLANVTFTVVGYGDSPITLGIETRLMGWDFGLGKQYDIINAKTMPFHIQHGYFSNTPTIHDVAVISVTASPTSVVAGETVDIAVVVENQGTVVETFAVTVYYGLLALQTKTVIGLPASSNQTLNFVWDTTGVATATYTMSAVASVVAGEEDIADNTYVDGNVRVNPTILAVIDAPDAGYTWTPITFDGSGSYSVGGTLVAWNWSFGDGAEDFGPIVSHPYKSPGVYGVLLVVEDNLGGVSVPAYHSIIISEPPAADLVKWKAKPEAHHWDESKDADGKVTLTALAKNQGSKPVNVEITFAILDARGGGLVPPPIVVDLTLDVPGVDVPVSVELDPYDYGYTGTKIVLFAYVTLKYDANEDGTPDTDASTKIVRFAVVP